LLFFFRFTVVLHLFCGSTALLLFFIFTTFLQLYCCSEALLLFSSVNVVL
jgi:hypothetical protein